MDKHGEILAAQDIGRRCHLIRVRMVRLQRIVLAHRFKAEPSIESLLRRIPAIVFSAFQSSFGLLVN